MAISFSRPDPSSPAAVGSAAFTVSRRGFDQGEVRDFLRMVAAELARLQERERFLESELRAMQTRGMSGPGQLDEQTVTTLLGEEAARVLSTARDASLQIRDRAEESATRLVKDAAEDAARIRESATIEAARIREDAAADAESEIEMAKQQGRDMVNEAREYREKVLSELSRRRDAARAQIEQLLHGRDRLINAFERARIASEHVIGEITAAHDEPEFIVDLAPTTGPVPVINPAHPSYTPSVQVFDREVEDERTSTGRTNASSIREVQRDEPVSVIDVPIDEPEVVEVAAEESLNDAPVVEHIDHEPTDVVSMGSAPVIDAPVTSETAIDESPTSNVVSLFGRGRRSAEVPEIADPEVAETEVVEPQVAEVEVVEAEVVEPEIADPEVAEPEIVEAEVAETHHKTEAALDDIFSKLRAGTTAEVAEKASADTSHGAGTSDKAKKPAAKPKATVTVDATVFAKRDEALSELVTSMSRRLKRVLVDEQNEVLEHLRNKRSSLEVEAILGTPAEHSERYATSIATETTSAAGAGAKVAGGSVRRVGADHVAAEVARAVDEWIVAEFREDARIAIGEAEGDRDVLASLMRDVYRKWKSEMIDRSVEDIAVRAFGHGALVSLEPGVQVVWVAAPGGCCSDCEDNSLADPQGRDIAFPTGHAHAPAHLGCRCLVWPVRN